MKSKVKKKEGQDEINLFIGHLFYLSMTLSISSSLFLTLTFNSITFKLITIDDIIIHIYKTIAKLSEK